MQALKVGPKKVASLGPHAAIYLPKELAFLKGRIVQLTIEIVDLGGDGKNG